MKRIIFSLMLISGTLASYAGGILTNTNQSAAYVRMLSRNATTDADGVFYNPAGLAFLDNGFHISFTEQFLFQKRTIYNDYPYLNDKTYTGDVTVPIFPSLYAAYKKDDWIFFAGFNPTGGGGKATFNNGLPSFETTVSNIPSMLTQQGIPTSNYSLDMSFDGSSVFYGIQLGTTYKINDWLSVSGGARFIYANNKYDGYLKNIRINPISSANPTNGFIKAQDFFSGLAQSASSAATSLQSFIAADKGNVTLAQAQGAGLLTEAQMSQLQAGLGKSFSSSLTIDETQKLFREKAITLTGYAAATSDKIVDAKQTGYGITPIIGVDIKPNEDLNIGIRYEFKTSIDLENKTKEDGTGMFPDGEKTRKDMPAILAIGAEYRIIPDLKVSASWTHFFDKDVNWSGKEKFISDNLYELAIGTEYNITDRLQFSIGYMYIQTGASQGYQSDLDYSLSSNSIGLGTGFKLTDNVKINIGVLTVQYVEGTRSIDYANGITAKETYNKSNTGFALGIDYKF